MDRQVQSGKKTVFLICFFIKYETKLVLICRFFIYNAQWAKNSAIRNKCKRAIKFQKLVLLFCGRQNRTVQNLFIALFGTNLEIYIPTYLGNH